MRMVGRHSHVTWRRLLFGQLVTRNYQKVAKASICITITTVMYLDSLDSTPRELRLKYSLGRHLFVGSSPNATAFRLPHLEVACPSRRKPTCSQQTQLRVRRDFVTLSQGTSVRKFTLVPSLRSISSRKFSTTPTHQDSATTLPTFDLKSLPSLTTVQINHWPASKSSSECVSRVRPYVLKQLSRLNFETTSISQYPSLTSKSSQTSLSSVGNTRVLQAS